MQSALAPLPIFLPELRRTEVKKLFEQIGPSGKCRLVLVNGEAGVGKTHFIERVAEDLRSRCSFDVLCFTVTEDNQDDLLTRVVRDCLTPPLDRTTFRDLALAVQSALLSDEFELVAWRATSACLLALQVAWGNAS